MRPIFKLLAITIAVFTLAACDQPKGKNPNNSPNDGTDIPITVGETLSIEVVVSAWREELRGGISVGDADSEERLKVKGARITAAIMYRRRPSFVTGWTNENGSFNFEMPNGASLTILASKDIGLDDSVRLLAMKPEHVPTADGLVALTLGRSGHLVGAVRRAGDFAENSGIMASAATTFVDLFTTTEPDGSFSMTLPAGDWAMEFSANGYRSVKRVFSIVRDKVTDAGEILLAPAAVLPADQSAHLTVTTVNAGYSTPVSGAAVRVYQAGGDTFFDLADKFGQTSFDIPAASAGAAYNVVCSAKGYLSNITTISISPGGVFTAKCELTTNAAANTAANSAWIGGTVIAGANPVSGAETTITEIGGIFSATDASDALGDWGAIEVAVGACYRIEAGMPGNTKSGFDICLTDEHIGRTMYFTIDIETVGPLPAPETAFIDGPDDPSASSRASFIFYADMPARFECSLDNAAFSSCAGAYVVEGIAPGAHQMRVRAINTEGTPDPTPALWSWTSMAADCDSSDPNRWRFISGYRDNDGDGYGAGGSLQVCSGLYLPPGYSNNNQDCNDADRDNWLSCSTCTDLDGDGYHYGCDAYITTFGPDACEADPYNWTDAGCTNCIDVDGDGYGNFCDLGGDENDTDVNCQIGCLPSCQDNDNDLRDGYNPASCPGGTDLCDNSRNNWTHFGCSNCNDFDQDGYYQNCDYYISIGGPDCNDGNPNTYTSGGCLRCSDLDGDGYYYGCDNYTTVPGPDCNDGNPAVTINCNNCSDSDGDGRPGFDPIYCPSGSDACENDPNNWTLSGCSNCADADSDSWFIGCDGYNTINGPDCDDADQTFTYSPGCTRCVDNDGDGRDGYDAIYCQFGADNCDGDPNNWTSGACSTCSDGDGDSWFAGCDAYNTITGPDCNDADYGYAATCPVCADADGDGANGYHASYCPAGNDFCDGDVNNWNPSGCLGCTDGDADLWFVGCDVYTTISGPDCNDGDYNYTINCPICVDADGDGYDGYDAVSCSTGNDNCDGDPNNWTAGGCASCADGDSDGWYDGCDTYTTVNGPDCDDADPVFNPGADDLFNEGIDYNCDGYDGLIFDDFSQNSPNPLYWESATGDISYLPDSGVMRFGPVSFLTTHAYDLSSCDKLTYSISVTVATTGSYNWDDAIELEYYSQAGNWKVMDRIWIWNLEYYGAMYLHGTTETTDIFHPNAAFRIGNEPWYYPTYYISNVEMYCNLPDFDNDGRSPLDPAAFDCDDSDPNNWDSCGTCVDADFDGAYDGCDAYVTLPGPDCAPSDPVFGQANDDLFLDGVDYNCDGDDGMFDDFDPNPDPGIWAAPMPIGVTSYTSYSKPGSILMDNIMYPESHTMVITRPFDTSGCSTMWWEYRVKTFYYFSVISLSYQNSLGEWVVVDTSPWVEPIYNNFERRFGKINYADAFHAGMSLRLSVPDYNGDLIVDDFHFVCGSTDADNDWHSPDTVTQFDCDDNNPNVWDSCATCDDADGDGWFVGCDIYDTISGPDCDDGDPAVYPGASDFTIDGVDNNCDGADGFFDDFEPAELQFGLWDSMTGDSEISTTWYSSGIASLNLGGGIGDVRTFAYNLSGCTELSWEYFGKRGWEQPDAGEFLRLQYFSTVSGWVDMDAWEGGATDPSFAPRSGLLSAADAFHSGSQFRFTSNGSGSCCDDFYVDDLWMYCSASDFDGDGYNTADPTTPDCDDSDPNNWSGCSTCLDLDGDGYYSGCDMYATLPGPDCDDSDPLWTYTTDCTRCVDADGDGADGRDYLDCPNGLDFCDADPGNQSAGGCINCGDKDGDGWFANCDDYSLINGPDCNDADPLYSDNCTDCVVSMIQSRDYTGNGLIDKQISETYTFGWPVTTGVITSDTNHADGLDYPERITSVVAKYNAAGQIYYLNENYQTSGGFLLGFVDEQYYYHPNGVTREIISEELLIDYPGFSSGTTHTTLHEKYDTFGEFIYRNNVEKFDTDNDGFDEQVRTVYYDGVTEETLQLHDYDGDNVYDYRYLLRRMYFNGVLVQDLYEYQTPYWTDRYLTTWEYTNGQLTRKTRTDHWDSGYYSSSVYYQTDYEYDASARLISKSSFRDDGADGIDYTYCVTETTEYDASGEIKAVRNYSYPSCDGVLYKNVFNFYSYPAGVTYHITEYQAGTTYRNYYTYNPDYTLAQIHYIVNYSSGAGYQRWYNYSYDAAGNRIESLEERDNDYNGTIDGVWYYSWTYNPAGEKTEETFYYDSNNDGTRENDWIRQYQYDAAGRMTYSIYTNYRYGTSAEYLWQYNPAGQLTLYSYSENAVLRENHQITYDAGGRNIYDLYEYYNGGVLYDYTLTVHQYNPAGQIVEYLYEFDRWDSDILPNITETHHYYYDEFGRRIGRTAEKTAIDYYVYGPTEKWSEYTYSYAPDGTIKSAYYNNSVSGALTQAYQQSSACSADYSTEMKSEDRYSYFYVYDDLYGYVDPWALSISWEDK